VGSKRFRGVLFVSKVGDHAPCHVHAFIGRGEVIVEFTADRHARLCKRDDAVRGATVSEVKKVLRTAAQHAEILLSLWEEAHA